MSKKSIEPYVSLVTLKSEDGAHIICPCGRRNYLGAYGVAQLAMGHSLRGKCPECGLRQDVIPKGRER